MIKYILRIFVIICSLLSLGITSKCQNNKNDGQDENINKYNEKIKRLCALVEKGSESRGRDEYTWYEAADILGRCRSVEAIPELVKKCENISERNGKKLSYMRLYNINDKPAAYALVNIGMPSVNPIIERYIKGKISRENANEMLYCILSYRQSKAYLVDYSTEYIMNYSDIEKNRLNDLTKGDALSIVSKYNNRVYEKYKNDEVVKLRENIITSQIGILDNTVDWNEDGNDVAKALMNLSKLRAVEAIPTIEKHLKKYKVIDKNVEDVIAGIGVPCIHSLINLLYNMDEKYVVYYKNAILRIVPKQCAKEFIDIHLKNNVINKLIESIS